VAAPGRGMCPDPGLRLLGQPLPLQLPAGHCDRGDGGDLRQLRTVAPRLAALDGWYPGHRPGPEHPALHDGHLSAAEAAARSRLHDHRHIMLSSDYRFDIRHRVSEW